MLLLGVGCVAVVALVLTAVGVGTWLVMAQIKERAAPDPPEVVAQPDPKPQPRDVPALPEAPPPRRKPMLPPFMEPLNPYKPGTQTRLREIRKVELPVVAVTDDIPLGGPNPGYVQILFSPRHQLLFVRRAGAVWVYDLSRNMALPARLAMDLANDMSLTPDESALFVADFGGTVPGYGHKPLQPSRVHRFDPVKRTWEDRKVDKPASRIRAVSADRFLLGHPSNAVTLNVWEKVDRVRELALIALGGLNLEYSPRTGRLYQPGARLLHATLDDDTFTLPTHHYNAEIGHGSSTLSADGSRLYCGRLQIDAERVERVVHRFPQMIFAASRDVAFGLDGYFDAHTGKRLGDYPFKADQSIKHSQPFGPSWYCFPAVSVSPDGLSMWIIDRDKNTARQFAIEGDK